MPFDLDEIQDKAAARSRRADPDDGNVSMAGVYRRAAGPTDQRLAPVSQHRAAPEGKGVADIDPNGAVS